MLALTQPRAVAGGDLPAPLRRHRWPRPRLASARRAAARRSRGARARTGASAPAPSRRCSSSSPTPTRSAYRRPTRRCPTGSRSRTASATNDAVRLFYGKPYDLLTVGGYTAWRVGGSLAILAAIWGLLAAIRATARGGGRGAAELVLAGIVGAARRLPRGAGGDRGGGVLLWLADSLASRGRRACSRRRLGVPGAGGRRRWRRCSSGVGALASQLAPTPPPGDELASACPPRPASLRGWSPTRPTALDWLRWATPLGWAEELRPFTGTRPGCCCCRSWPTVALLAVAGRSRCAATSARACLPARDSAPPRQAPARLAPRAGAARRARQLRDLACRASGFFALVLGVIATEHPRRGHLAALAAPGSASSAGFRSSRRAAIWASTSIFFVLALSLFCCAQIGGGAPRGDGPAAGNAVRSAGRAARAGWLGASR